MTSIIPIPKIPIPRIPITVRPATMADLAFIDGLQKMHAKQVGFMPRQALEGKIEKGHVLIAEEGSGIRGQGSGEEKANCISLSPEPSSLTPFPVGYLIGNDQYFKRDDVGIIYQMNVVPEMRRSLVAATLLKAQFDRSAYGCRLYCCWCAQDIEANHFWESMGFMPLAFRTGSEKKSRVHIFWQRRIRQGDVMTPWWFPSQTSSGSIREDRLVLPIPPGTHWKDAKPMILPGEEIGESEARVEKQSFRLRTFRGVPASASQAALPGLKFGALAGKSKCGMSAPQRSKRKNDPKLVAAARELRDRWLERVNEDPSMLLSNGKYDLCRAPTAPARGEVLCLPAPIAA